MSALLLGTLHSKSDPTRAQSGDFLNLGPRHLVGEGLHDQGITVGELVYTSLVECFQRFVGLAQVVQYFVHKRTIPGVVDLHYMGYSKCMSTTAEVLTEATTSIEAKGYTRTESFDIALAIMIDQDPATMRKFLEAAKAEYDATR
jgi:hypothetical protein